MRAALCFVWRVPEQNHRALSPFSRNYDPPGATARRTRTHTRSFNNGNNFVGAPPAALSPLPLLASEVKNGKILRVAIFYEHPGEF